jgi:predicted Zn-dependent protease
MAFNGGGVVSLFEKRKGLPLLLGALPAVLLIAACAVNPATGERQLTLMSEAQEVQMGREADPQIVGSMGLYPNDELQAYIQDLGSQLAARSERPDLPWTFRVLDDPTVNAFALPGGYIYVTRGIMAHLDSEAELAGVLGHEIGHVTARHSVSQISRQQLFQGLAVGAMIVKPELQRFGNLIGAGMQLLFLKYGRDDEHQADELGVRYMGRVGYDPHQLGGVMAMLGNVTSASGGGRVPEWLSTHPNPENRESNIEAMADSAEVAADPALVGRDRYLPRLEGLIYGTNPREGFFRDARFYHPDLAFLMDFPTGWQTANLKQAVQALSAEEDALMVLTVEQAETPRAGLDAFLGQEGIQAGQPRVRNRNGLATASAEFRAETEEGTLDGRVTYVRHGNLTYRLLGYAPTSVWPQRRGVVQESHDSFRRLTDSAYLNVEPARLRLVTVQRSMGLGAFLQREGATAFEEDVRLLNRIDGDGPIPAGTVMKVPAGGRLPG